MRGLPSVSLVLKLSEFVNIFGAQERQRIFRPHCWPYAGWEASAEMEPLQHLPVQAEFILQRRQSPRLARIYGRTGFKDLAVFQ